MSSQPDQANTIRDYLLSAMRTGEYAQCDRLPRESVLSEKMGISRTQLRDILAALEREGFITRRHGVGTIINHYVLDAQTRMDIEIDEVNPSDDSILASIAQPVSVIFKPQGFGSWKPTVATVTGLIAKENVVGTFGVLYNYDDAEEELAELPDIR